MLDNPPANLIGTGWGGLPWMPAAEAPDEDFIALLIYDGGHIVMARREHYYIWHWNVACFTAPDRHLRSDSGWSPAFGDNPIAYARIPS